MNPKIIIKISPSYDSTKLENKTLRANFDDFVDVYADRVRGWLLNWAHELNKPEHAGFAAVQLALAFLEGFAVFYYGEDSDKRSKVFFGRGLRLVFPCLDDLSDDQRDAVESSFYRHVRCGLFHLGMPRTGVILQDSGKPLGFDLTADNKVAAIFVDRHELVQAIRTRFETYVNELRDISATDRRKCFCIAWDIVHGR